MDMFILCLVLIGGVSEEFTPLVTNFLHVELWGSDCAFFCLLLFW